jgi:DNA processing protein
MYGRETATRLGEGLARRGWTVISGLATGIDAAAHRGALAGGGRTIGVLGGALDCFFPEANRALAREMVAAGGCGGSEFPFGRHPDAQTFPQRNRVVSGLSRGVVAVECPLRSGTLITCLRAAEQGRPVMAVPGRIDWKTSAGGLHLIRDGARLVTGVSDVLEEVMDLGSTARPPQAGATVRPGRMRVAPRTFPSVENPDVPLSADEARVYRAIPAGGATRDAVATDVDLPAGTVNALLVALRIKGRVRFRPGNRVELVSDRVAG